MIHTQQSKHQLLFKEEENNLLSYIVAMDKNRVIGKDNDLPWYLPNDLQFFKKTTTGHTIIMGRKTFDSLGRVLPNRKHVVLTRTKQKYPDEVIVVHTIDEIKAYIEDHAEEELFVIGGGNLFTQLLPHADRLYITEIHESFNGDVHFPEIDKSEWKEISRIKGKQDEKNKYAHDYVTYDKIS